jgi:hypothetical protein
MTETQKSFDWEQVKELGLKYSNLNYDVFTIAVNALCEAVDDLLDTEYEKAKKGKQIYLSDSTMGALLFMRNGGRVQLRMPPDNNELKGESENQEDEKDYGWEELATTVNNYTFNIEALHVNTMNIASGLIPEITEPIKKE